MAINRSSKLTILSKQIRKLEKPAKILFQLLYPLRCPVCDQIVTPMGERICLECIPKLKYITPEWCLKCGKKLTHGEREYCHDCSVRKHEFIRGRALYDYRSIAGSLYRFKYGGRCEYAGFYGEEIVRYLGGFIRQVNPDGLIPVPMYPGKQRRRGYNQAALLALEVGRQTGIPVYNSVLRRVKNTVPLKRLNPEERQNNLKKAFLMIRNDVELKKVIIIDDIYTTGSTIDEAAAALKAGGVEQIWFITLSCGAGL